MRRILSCPCDWRTVAPLLGLFLLTFLPCSSARADNWALLIGINRYQNSDRIPALGGADNDALAIAKTLHEVAGFSENHIHVLTSGGEQKPTKNAILHELQLIKQQTKPGDVLFILYSGHGIDSEGGPILLPYDADTSAPELIDESSILESKIKAFLKNVPARAVILIMDMCQEDIKAGRGGLEADNHLTDTMVKGLDFGIHSMKPERSDMATHPQIVATFFACSPQHRAYEWREKHRGYFSYFLEQGLRGAAADKTTHTVTLDSLKRYLATAVPTAVHSQEIGEEQVPTGIFDGPLEAGDFALVTIAPTEPSSNGLLEPSGQGLTRDYRNYQEEVKRGSSLRFFETYAPARYADWLRQAETGNAIAQLLVGRCYQEGIVVAKDDAVAAKWIAQAADQGNTFAINNLGYDFGSGLGVTRDEALANSMYLKAANQGNGLAMSNLGWNEYEAKNYTVAKQWFEKASGAGYAGAMRGLANIYNDGKGVPKDSLEANKWYVRAAAAGDSIASGFLITNRIGLAFKAYADPHATVSSRAAALQDVQGAIAGFKSVDLEAANTVLQANDVKSIVEALRNKNAPDPLLNLHSEMIERYVYLYQQSSLREKQNFAYDYSNLTRPMLDKLYSDKKYDQIVEFWKNSYSGLSIMKLTDGERDSLVHEMNQIICSLLKIDEQKEAKQLLDDTVKLCDGILSDRPWDWYTTDAYMGMCFDVAARLSEFGDSEDVQILLKRGWHIAYKLHGREDNLHKFVKLPLKGEIPTGASEDDVAFFSVFAPKKDESDDKNSKADDKYSIKRFTIPVDFDGAKYPFNVYILSGPNGYSELQNQFRWVKEYRGGVISDEIRDTFRKLNKIAIENKVDFCALCVYALGTDAKDGGQSSTRGATASTRSQNNSSNDDQRAPKSLREVEEMEKPLLQQLAAISFSTKPEDEARVRQLKKRISELEKQRRILSGKSPS